MREWIHAFVWAKRHWTGKLTASELPLVTKYLQPSDTVIDVGAHAGSWSVPLSRLVPQGRVIAIEALPYYAGVLSQAIRILNRNNIEVINVAVTAAPTLVKLVWKDPAGRRITGFTHIAGPGENDSGTVEVAGKPLDALVNGDGRVRLIKIDIEGAELGVLKGAVRVIQTHRPLIFMELTPELLARYDSSVEQVFALLGAWQYRAYAVTEQIQLRPVADAGDYHEHDVLFAPSEFIL